MNHNTINDANPDGMKLAINKFSDLTEEEFKVRMGLKPIQIDDGSVEMLPMDSAFTVPDSVDWR